MFSDDEEKLMAIYPYVMFVSPTVDQVAEIMRRNGQDEETIQTWFALTTDEMLKYKAICTNGTMWDVDCNPRERDFEGSDINDTRRN